LGTEGLLAECCDYLSRNFLLAMVSNEISTIRQIACASSPSSSASASSALSREHYNEATGVRNVLVLKRDSAPNSVVAEDGGDDGSTSSSSSSSPSSSSNNNNNNSSNKRAMRVPISKSAHLEGNSSELSATMKSFLLFLRDVAQVLEFIAENVFNGDKNIYIYIYVHIFCKLSIFSH
jgi:hypothetical protein